MDIQCNIKTELICGYVVANVNLIRVT